MPVSYLVAVGDPTRGTTQPSPENNYYSITLYRRGMLIQVGVPGCRSHSLILPFTGY